MFLPLTASMAIMRLRTSRRLCRPSYWASSGSGFGLLAHPTSECGGQTLEGKPHGSRKPRTREKRYRRQSTSRGDTEAALPLCPPHESHFFSPAGQFSITVISLMSLFSSSTFIRNRFPSVETAYLLRCSGAKGASNSTLGMPASKDSPAELTSTAISLFPLAFDTLKADMKRHQSEHGDA
jgi:hypothetical protein